MRIIVFLFVLAASTAASAGTQVRYAGVHPIPKPEGGGICYIEGPHVHLYAADQLQYRLHDGDYVFVGDPVPYGYVGERAAYKGPHAIHIDVVVGGTPAVEYCYLEKPHYHAFAPAAGDPDFKRAGDVYVYTKTPKRDPELAQINVVYNTFVYARPTVTVEVHTPPARRVVEVHHHHDDDDDDDDDDEPRVIVIERHEHHHHHHHKHHH